MRYLSLIFFIPLLLLSAQESLNRVWTNTEGASFEGLYIESTDKDVTIKRLSDSQIFTVPISIFSDVDIQWINNQRKKEIKQPELPTRLEWPSRVSIRDFKIEFLETHIKTENLDLHLLPFSESRQRAYAAVFEDVYQSLSALPFPIPLKDRLSIREIDTRAEFILEGAPSSSTFHVLKEGEIILRSFNLGRYLNRVRSSLVWSMLLASSQDVEPFITAGIAEYISAIPRRANSDIGFSDFNISNHFGREVVTIPLLTILNSSNQDWIQNNVNSDPRASNGALLVGWFLMRRDNNGLNLYKYFQELQNGSDPEAALQLLLGHRTKEDLVHEIHRYFERYRIRILEVK